jgi:uncharacterized membrane protein
MDLLSLGHGAAIRPADAGVRLTDLAAPARRSRFQRLLHPLFEASLVVKGGLAGLEALAGLGLLLTANHFIHGFVDWLSTAQIADAPHDRLALAMRALTEGLSIQSQHFYALYLCTHGGLKLVMVLLLARRIRWAYPAAMVVLAGFVTYQMAHYLETASAPLLILSAFDCIMIALVWREWRLLPLG